MRRHWPLVALLAWTLTLPGSLVRADETLAQRYLEIYLKINAAEQLEKQGDTHGALAGFEDCYTRLAQVQQEHPDWEPALVIKRLGDCQSKISGLEDALSAKLSAEDAVKLLASFTFVSTTNEAPTKYPWRRNMTPTEFWIGEDASGPASAWDDKWEKHNGGADSPEKRQRYAPADHAPTLNTFYVALPFNDLAHPDLAKKWLPKTWNKPTDNSTASACKDRWVQLKNEAGDTCYAQWEDVGPNGGDDPQYVFGDAAPKGGKDAAAIDVSPAVAKYLNLQPEGSGKLVSWRFVNAEDVPPGYWLKYDEEAILYAAMHGEAKDSSTHP